MKQRKGTIFCRVAGANYRNENGTDRQEILRRILCSSDKNPDVTLVPYTYNGKPALHVMFGDDCVGDVPAEYAHAVYKVFERIEKAYIMPDKFKDESGRTVYYADLDISYTKGRVKR